MNIEFEYVVKFVQGKVDAPDPEDPNYVPTPVAPGEYWTAINVYNPNPNPNDKPVELRKKVVIAKPEDEDHLEPSGTKSPILEPGRALEIDREDIFRLFFPNENPDQNSLKRFLKGFVVIKSEEELDVVAVYTAAGVTQHIEALHTERILPRRVEIPEE